MQPDCVAPRSVHSDVLPEQSTGESITEVLASLIGELQFDLWFRQKTRLAVDGEELVVYAASPFQQKWLQKQHRLPLTRAAQTVLGASARVRFDVESVPPAEASGNMTERADANAKSGSPPAHCAGW